MNGFVGAFLDDYEYTSHSGTQTVAFGDRVRTDDGTVYQYMGVGATLVLDEAVEDYTDYGYWKPLSETSLLNDAVAYAALSALGTVLDDDGLNGAAAVYFGLIDHNDVRSVVDAWIERATIVAGGDVSVSSLESAAISADDSSYVSTWEGKGAVIVTNVVLADSQAWIDHSSISGRRRHRRGDRRPPTLTATATSQIEALRRCLRASSLAFNSIGWKPSNFCSTPSTPSSATR